MILKSYKPLTPSLRFTLTTDYKNLINKNTNKKLIKNIYRSHGRNNKGRITTRHKGGGHKQLYRKIDFKRNNYNIYGLVNSIEYDPNRNVFISLIHFENGDKRYILHPEGLNVGDSILSGTKIELKIGNSLPLKDIAIGTDIHNIELYPQQGGIFVRAAGLSAKIISKDKGYVSIRLPSKELRLFNENCYATIGKLDNADFFHKVKGKAGRSRWLGIRPSVRGSAMNAVDHPHGGGEGRSPIGKPNPRTPWGKIALGVKTRKRNKLSNKFILHRKK